MFNVLLSGCIPHKKLSQKTTFLEHRNGVVLPEKPLKNLSLRSEYGLNFYITRAKKDNLINVVNNLSQCCAAPCQQCCAAPCQQLLSTTIVHSCSRSTIIVQLLLTTINKLFSSTIVSSCSNNTVTTIDCSLSTSNNYWSNNTHQHCEFNKCCWTLITTLFRRCSANNVVSTWRIFARVFNSWVSRDVIISLGVNSKSMHSHRREIVFYIMCWPCVWQQICAISWDLFTPLQHNHRYILGWPPLRLTAKYPSETHE